MTTNSDPSLGKTSVHVRKAVLRDVGSLGWLVLRYSPLLVAQARYRLGPRLRRVIDPEDIVQEVWAVALERAGDLPEAETAASRMFLKFLTTTLLNKINTRVQKHILGKPTVEEVASDGEAAAADRIAGRGPGALTAAGHREAVERLEAALEEMSEADREVVVLRFIEQRENREVALLLHLEPGTVSQRLHRALERLRGLLPADLLGDPGPG